MTIQTRGIQATDATSIRGSLSENAATVFLDLNYLSQIDAGLGLGATDFGKPVDGAALTFAPVIESQAGGDFAPQIPQINAGQVGSIAFTAFQSDNTGGAGGDYFQFVLLAPVTAGTTIYFTDGGYRTDVSAFRTNENALRWVAQSDLAAGTVVSFVAPNGTGSASTAEWTGINPATGAALGTAALGLATAGDNIAALINPTFGGTDLLTGTAIAQITWGGTTFSPTFTAASGNATTALAPGLTDGVNAISITPTDDGLYTGTVFTGTQAQLLAALNNDANWTTSTNPFTVFAPTTAFSVQPSGAFAINDPVAVTEGDSGTTAITFTVTRSGDPFGAASIDWAVDFSGVSNPANAADFSGTTSGTLAFASNQTSQTITINVQGDTTVEPDENFRVVLSNNSAGTTISDNSGTGTILNDDVAPAPATITVNDVSVSEGDTGTTALVFTITRSNNSGAFTLDYVTANETALAGSDYVATSGSVSFAAGGALTQTVSVTVNGDYIVEGNETLQLNLSNVVNTTGTASISDEQGIGTITNDDVAGTLTVANVSIAEGNGGTTTVLVAFTRTGGLGAFSFDLATADGTATDGVDYVGLVGNVPVDGNVTAFAVPITINGDTIVEGNETFFVNLSNPTDGLILGNSQAVVTITNDDAVTVGSVSIDDVSIVEGNAGTSVLTFTVTRSGGSDAFAIDYATTNGGNPNNASATAGSDYVATSGTLSFGAGVNSQTVSVTINGDGTPELSEEFRVLLSNGTNGVTITDESGVGTITNDDTAPSSVSLFATDFTGFTAAGFSPTPAAGQLNSNFWRIQGFSDNSGLLDYGATAGVGDYGRGVLSGDPTTAGIYSLSPNPAFVIQPTGAEFGTTPGTITLRVQNLSGQLASSLDFAFDYIYRNNADRSTTATLSYATSAAATQPSTFTALSAATFSTPVALTTGAVFTSQNVALNIPVPLAANDYVFLRFSLGDNAVTPGSGSRDEIGFDNLALTANLGSGGAATPLVTVSNASVNEDAGTLTFTVTRSNLVDGAFTVDFATANGTALAGSDYTATSGTLSFAVNQVQALVTVPITVDAIPENDETFLLNLSNASGATIATPQATGTIVNDDGAPIGVTINDVSIVEGNSGTSTATFTVTRTGGAGAFSVDFATSDGTATAGSDYVATNGRLDFAAGQNSQTISVTINGDTTSELTENFNVTLSNATNFAVLNDALGVGTITNDDNTLISQIQGDSYYSPLLRASGVSGFNIASSFTVTVQAIVTALDGVGNRQGFYIQEELTDQDGNPFTSEGIFVLTRTDGNVGSALSAVAPALRVGDLVTLTANIEEYQGFTTNLPITALVNPTGITINSSGNTLPTIILDSSVNIPNQAFTQVTPDFTDSVDNPGDSFDAVNYGISFWETVEGELVSIPNVRVADGFVSTSGGQPFFKAYSEDHANPEQINSRGGYTIGGDPALSPPDTASVNDNVLRGGQVVHDGDVNPDVFEVDFTGFATPAPAGLATSATIGDRLGTLNGIIDFDFQELKLFVTSYDPASIQTTGQPAPEVATYTADARQLTFATFNVNNLDPTDGAARFTNIANAIATNLKAPDILSIEEIQDNNGAAAGDGTSATGTDASTTWQMLVDALNLRTGAHYQWVDELPVYNAEGGELSGNIRVGFLYNTDRVQLGDLAANATIAERRQFTDRIGDGVRDAGDRILYSDDQVAGINPSDWAGTRRSLLGQFTFNGETVFVAANHFPSKGGSGNFYQFNQDLESGNPANAGFARRNAVAEDLYTVLNRIQINSPNAGIISGGDYNDFQFYRPLEAATGYVFADGTARNDGARLTNLTLTLPEAERYTYAFDGRSQAIDHVLVNQQLADIASYDVVHINTGYNANGTGADANPALSDHDPAVVQLDFRQRAETLTGTAAGETINGFGGNDVIDGNGGTDTLIGGLGDDIFYVDSLDDIVIENAGEGFDTVYTSIAGYVLPTNVERLIYTGTANQNESGNSGDNQFTGGSGSDTFDLSQGGNDTANGGDGNDAFFFGAAFDANDNVDGGTGANDQIGLQGNYGALTLGANSTRNVEVLAVLPGAGFGYNITTVDANVAAGQELVVFGTNLGADNNLTFNGSAETDGTFRVYGGLGVDNITLGAGNDGAYFGPGRFGASDFVNGGAGTNDQVALDGNYTATISAAQLQNVEVLVLLRGVTGDLANYNITLTDDLVGAGQTFTVFGLAVETGFTLNASAETNGNVTVFGGSGNDTITTGNGADRIFGGGGADLLNGGAGADTFVYDAVSQSTGVTYDRIVGFVSGVDRLDFNFTVTGVDATVGAGALSTASFDANLAAVIGAGQLAANHAVLFTADAGDLAGQTFLVVDANGVAGYQAGSDYVIQLVAPPASLVTGDFI